MSSLQQCESEYEKTYEFLQFIHLNSKESFPDWIGPEKLAEFLNRIMRPYEDTVVDISRGIEYALSEEPGLGGFIIFTHSFGTPIGAVVFLETGMKGYVSENLLLFIGVHPDHRGKGIGRELILRALKKCEGDVKLHVEPDNVARHLYESVGFEYKYLEMRLKKNVNYE